MPKPLLTRLRVSKIFSLAFSDSMWGQDWERMLSTTESCALLFSSKERSLTDLPILFWTSGHCLKRKWCSLGVTLQEKTGYSEIAGRKKVWPWVPPPKKKENIWKGWQHCSKYQVSSLSIERVIFFLSILWVRTQRIHSRAGAFG